MKQIEYTEKQLLVLEILDEVEKLFKPDKNAYDFQRREYFQKINQLKDHYGIKEKYLTLREYLKKHSCGAYHNFIFKIEGIDVDVMGIEQFERYYNSSLLDKYFVLKDNRKEFGSNCENYNCEHYLELVKKD